MPESHPPMLIVIVGPTAVGKTEIAIQLAERLHGEIVSADSRLFYRGLDIGTAKPAPAELARVPHHLIDIADPDETMSLAVFHQLARQAICQIHARRQLPFLVGGSGQYIQAVNYGWEVPRVEPDFHLRKVLKAWADEIGMDGLHQRLAVLDPAAAAGIDPRNVRRTIRALEVILTTGQRFSAQRQRTPAPYKTLLLGLTRPRSELYARVDARIEAMLAAGFIQEVQGLLEQGYSPDLPCLSAIGYREIIAYLAGKITLDEAIVQIKRSTRIFVRRQANWFKLNDPEIHWVQVNHGIINEIESRIKQFVN